MVSVANLGTANDCRPPRTETDVYYGYDLLGRGLYANYGSTSGPGVSSTWDALGRRTSTTASGRTLANQYDLAGNRTRITWPDTGANALFVTYVYDNLNRMTAVEENGATSGVGLLATYTYDAMGERASESRAGGAGATTTAHDDAAGRLLTFAHNFTSTGNNVSWTFGYTPANQLVSSSTTNDAYSYHPGAQTNAYLANGLNQYASVNGSGYTYDAKGNLSAYGNKNLVFDIENRLVSATSPTALTVTYDPLERLQSTATTSATTNFLYDGANLAGEYDGSGNILRRYVFGPNTDEPVVWYEGAGTANRRWLHADRQGSVIAWSTSTGALGAASGYGPYGEPAAWSGSRFAYTGQIMIPELQLYYYKARVYDPAIGSFLQTDPIGYRSDMNVYAYTREDPVNGTDPSGMDNWAEPPTTYLSSTIYTLGFGAAQTPVYSAGNVLVNGTSYAVFVGQGTFTSPTNINIDFSNQAPGWEAPFGGPQGGGGYAINLAMPQNVHSCPGVDFSAGGSLNGALISPGGSVGAGLIVHVPFDLRHGWQVSVVGQGTFTWGLGAFIGAGASFGFPASSSTQQSGGSTFKTGDFIAEGGWGPAASVEVQGNPIGSSASMGGPHLGPGAGYGAYVGKGTAWGARYTSPAFGC